MQNTGYIALSAQTALWRRMETVANNLANMNTTNYRRQDTLFTDYMVRTPNTDSVFRDQVRFVQDFGTVNDLSQGPIRHTGNTLDVALERPDVFLSVETPAGEKYSRGGSLILNEQGQLSNHDGYPIMTDNNTPIFIAPNESQISIMANGTVATENGPVGRLKTVTFENPQRLKRYGSTLWEAPAGMNAEPAQRPGVVQGALEGSNVNGIIEITRMIDIQRAYERSNMMIEREDERVRRTMDTWARRSA
ncbi:MULTISPECIES: flagellar basal-body rod protein FlgF [unclassified Haematospirillum]|uniref:flagellar basal-body rod protein FlgF n=1 Tax=unclassified Haematospirillum TaxID=2622088 RepID=UPI00143A2F16|nr:MULTISPECIES: flagellar basal-body rod protein FlgF [unclassified Haematospirillum]NKD55823.1 flagellar basal-body rod protein FlgF [Haematospirillum sp. H4890]NKD75866.1 flagellar basal-body rod protein FlgF [Haematospirillum sp. H4485]NKD87956.1 flagellar basal-body rod protein FlgF [Haematospirillum sp. 15-248]